MNNKLNKEIDELFEDCPKVKDILKEIKKLYFADLDKDPDFVAGFEMGRIQEEVLKYIDENNIPKEQFKGILYEEWSERPIKDIFKIVMDLGKELTISIKG